jgi:NCS1 family nucleobase:cation symporter-1
MAGIRALAASKKRNAQRAFTSWDNFQQWLQVPETELDRNGQISAAHHRWSNEDLDPTPPEKRTWAWYNYVIFYWGLSFGNWQLGSTMVGIGLNWWQAILTIFLSQFISSIAMFFNSRCASVYHIGYPVVGRSVFGMYGAYYFVGVRAALAIIWFAVQTFVGSSLLAVMLRAIFGESYTNIPNTLPADTGITSAGMVAFLIFWLAQFPFAFLRPYQLTKFFWFKAIIMLPAIWGLFIFCMANTKGQVGLGTLAQGNSSGGWGWFFVYSINAGMGNTATLICNQPDLARWSKTKTGAMWSQLITNPIAVTLSAALGILSTAAINNAWGLELWNPWGLMDAILTRYWSGTTRFAIFLASFAWSFTILGTNIAANMIPFGADATMLLPRYITIPRGQVIVALLAFAVVPWKVSEVVSTQKFRVIQRY